MFRYGYGAHFGSYFPNNLASVFQGTLGSLGTTAPGMRVAVSLITLAIIEVILSASDVLAAWTWPTVNGDGA